MADKFDSGDHAKRILLVPDFLQAHLLDLSDLLELVLWRPLEVILAEAIVVRFEHRQLANALLRSLQMHRALLRWDAVHNSFEFFFGHSGDLMIVVLRLGMGMGMASAVHAVRF